MKHVSNPNPNAAAVSGLLRALVAEAGAKPPDLLHVPHFSRLPSPDLLFGFGSDPCLSCATHALGKMLLQVELLDADGVLLDRLSKGGNGEFAHSV